jgi:cytochrome c553
VGGILATLLVGPERGVVGRHRLNRRLHDEEMAEIEAWLDAVRASKPMRQE